MPFPYDRYPWLNFQELNLAYFIRHFREIFQQWDQLYHDLTEWKEETDQDLAEWKAATEAGLESWKTGLMNSLETWKSQTESDISGWESAALAALDAWQSATTAVFEEIRVQAAGSASAAAASASAADTARAAAISAQTAAEQAATEISAELAQIQTNAENIADLKNALLQKFRMYSCENLLDNVAYPTRTSNGVHFEQDGLGVHIEGTSSAAIVYDFMVGDFPAWLEPGVEYHVQFDNDDPNILFQIYAYDTEGYNQLVYNSSGNGTATFSPNYSATIRMRIRINAADVTVNKTFYPSITATLTNRELESALNSVFKGELLINSSTVLADFNDAVINRYYSINTTDIAHQPIPEKGHLLYFGINGGNNAPLTGRAVQIFITNSAQFFFRFVYFSSPVEWSDWRELTETSYTSISIFQSMGIIGDSFASGEIYSGSSHTDYYNVSWGQILGRSAGITIANYSEGGLTAKSWLTDTDHGKAAMDTDTVKQCYIIALGINDARAFGTAGLGTLADLSASSTADTFYRYMGSIRRAIKTHAPNAIIIWSTLARSGNAPYPYDDYSYAVQRIAEYYSDPMLNLSKDDYFTSDFFAANQISNHPTAVTYSGMAAAYKRMIERYMRDNPSKFSGFTG